MKDYFHLLPDNLNPNINKLQYNVDVVIGMFLAYGDGVTTIGYKSFNVVCNDGYLHYMGILSKNICELDYWVYSEFKKRGHQ